jgi:hypothetical protein
MARYEITGPDGARYEVTAPDNMPESAVLERARGELGGQQAKPERSWGDWLQRMGGAAAQGALGEFGDELGIVDREADKQFSEESPVASTVARVGGGIAPFVAGPGAWAARAAVASPRLLGRIAGSAGLNSTVGTVYGLGAGEGDLADRLPSGQMGGLLGLGLGAAAPPVAGAIGRVAGMAAPVVSRAREAFRRPTEPPLPFSAFDNIDPTTGKIVEGARFINEMAPGDIANAQTRMLGSIRDAMLREGITPAQMESQLDELATWATRFNSSSYGQDVVTPADLSPGLRRLLGTLARQSPEAERDIWTFLTARQTGITPQGADPGRLAQRGIPTQDRFAQPITGRQAQEAFGPEFQRAPTGDLRTGLGNIQPMGHHGRTMDVGKRSLLLRDEDFHGHAANPGRTMDDINTSMKTDARRNYGALYKLGQRVDLRPTIAPVLEAWEAKAAAAQPPLSDFLTEATRLFRTKATGEVVRDIENFDRYGKQYLDDVIRKAFKGGDNAPGIELTKFRDEMFAALTNSSDTSTRRIAALYGRARSDYNTDAARQELIEKYRGIWKGDPRRLLDEYQTLPTADKKLARLGMLWGAEDQTAGVGLNRNITGIFNTPRAQQIVRAIIPRTQTATGRAKVRGGEVAEFADRTQRLGAYLDYENMFPETRNVALGGSMTARNLQDDVMQVALDASQNIQSLMGVLRGNQSLYQLVERGITWAWDRSFGVGADAAREGVRMLLTANPAERTAMLRQVAAIYPADRMAHFNQLMQRIQAGVAGPGVAGSVAGASGAPTPQPQQGGPMQL